MDQVCVHWEDRSMGDWRGVYGLEWGVQWLSFVSVHKNQISMNYCIYLHSSMREVDSHTWMLQESLWELILWFSSKVRPWHVCTSLTNVCSESDLQHEDNRSICRNLHNIPQFLLQRPWSNIRITQQPDRRQSYLWLSSLLSFSSARQFQDIPGNAVYTPHVLTTYTCRSQCISFLCNLRH